MKANLVYRGIAYQQHVQSEVAVEQTLPGMYRGAATLLSISESQPALKHNLPLIYRGSVYSVGTAATPVTDVALQPAI